MKKSVVLKTLLALSIAFVVFQILAVSYVFRNGKGKSKPTIEVEEFLKQSRQQQIPLFLLELDLLSGNEWNEDSIKVLHGRQYITLGLNQHYQKQDIDIFTEKFESQGFRTVTSTHTFTKPIQEEISHIFLLHEQLTVHIVLFFKRTPELVWCTPVNDDTLSKLDLDIRNKPFVEYSFLLKSFELKRQNSILLPHPKKEFVESIPSSRFIECNETRAGLFKEKYPTDNVAETQTFQRKSRQIIARAKRYLDDLDIQFWLSSGTCLGWYRQCDIITYSKDVDFGIWIKDYKPQLIPVFEHGGFFLKHVFGKVSDSYELSFQAGDIKLDLFFFYEENNTMWNGGTHHETGQKYKYIFPKFSLCWTEFLELYVRVPCPPGPYIEANYGKNWIEPVKSWEWNRSPPNVQENGFWDKNEWMDVIQVY